ncbi:trichohyalin-like isoform X2 [Mya arenaria]|uniref:trichohyalin-like isoform X2 n=1 Tax=Mya arenaria TaxID=6604 RepID=UPI0022DEAF18|nr:trichohyalin-like isoform X2 [Mya arenaria]
MGELLPSDRGEVLKHVFNQYDRHGKGELSPLEVQNLHGDIRMGGISYPQVLASMKYVCGSLDCCTLEELHDLLQEMDRRYFLVQDLRWEFSLLDREHKDTITEHQAMWMVQAMHGKNFSKRKWASFLQLRAVPGSPLAFPEIEVLLCNVKSSLDVLQEREEEERERRERLEHERLRQEEERRERERLERLKDEERRRKEEAKQRLEEDARRKMMEEEEERRHRQQELEEEERRREEQRLLELEERGREEEERRRQEELEKYKDAEKIVNFRGYGLCRGCMKETELEEADILERLRVVREKLQTETDGRKRVELQEEEQRLLRLLRDLKHKRIRYKLKVAIKERDRYKLEYSVNEFKTEKVEDVDMDLEKAERLLREITSRDNLRRAVSRREIEELEKAIATIKRNGLEVQLARELIEANVILTRLRKIQRIRSEILELKQSTVAEIRSYQKPPPVVHTVMTATFLILGHKEKETKDWKTVQALVGKTGKDGLKRRCLECDASKIPMETARRARQLLEKQELDEVRDVSAGAATFYVFTFAMVEECFDIDERGPLPDEETNPTSGPSPGEKAGKAGRQRVDPTKMTIQRSRQVVTNSGTAAVATELRNKTPTRKK